MNNVLSTPAEFSKDALYNKAKIYMNKSFNDRNDGNWELFWFSLSLEFMLRASLANISPLLLADNSSKNDNHILFALGYQLELRPRSITVISVMQRLKKIGLKFTDETYQQCETIIEARNAELHSGAIGFDILQTKKTKENYYKVIMMLLDGMNKTLIDFVGEDEAESINRIILTVDKQTKERIDAQLNYCKLNYSNLDEEEKQKKVEANRTKDLQEIKGVKVIKCPACDNPVAIVGEKKLMRTEFIEGDIKQTVAYIPKALKCECCNFELKNFTEFKSIKLDDEFCIVENIDPIEYYGIDVVEYLSDDERYEIAKQYNEDEYGAYGDE